MNERGIQMGDSPKTIGLMILATLTLICLPGARAEAAGWQWALTPYLWASDVSMEIEEAGEPVGGVDLGFGDLLDKVDLASQMHFEGRRGVHGILFDVTYIDAGKNQSLMDITLSPDIDLFIIEVGGFFSTNEEVYGLDLLYGARILDIDQQIDLLFPEPVSQRVTAVDISDSLTDVFLGLRYSSQFGQKGSFHIRGDYGFGDTEGTANVVLGLGYGLGQTGKYRLLVGYRHMELEIEDGTTETELEMSGPMLALQINFGG
jgi:hypothetical protein